MRKRKRLMRNCLIALVVLAFLRIFPVCAQEVVVSTDKAVYPPSEEIKITVKNVSGNAVFSAAAGSTPSLAISNIERKLSQWSWDAFRPHCSRLECDDIDSGEPVEIKAGESAVFLWKPQIYQAKKYSPPKPGLYRLTIIYQIRKEFEPKKWIWKTTQSNEFNLE